MTTNLINVDNFFVVGKLRARRQKDDPPCVVVSYASFERGWKQRVVQGNAPELNVDYISNETVFDIQHWIPFDFIKSHKTFLTLQEATEYQANMNDLS